MRSSTEGLCLVNRAISSAFRVPSVTMSRAAVAIAFSNHQGTAGRSVRGPWARIDLQFDSTGRAMSGLSDFRKAWTRGDVAPSPAGDHREDLAQERQPDTGHEAVYEPSTVARSSDGSRQSFERITS
jgi:hypothetical protein